MAWIFSLSAECGGEQVAAVQFAQHFDTVAWILSNGSQVLCQAEVLQDLDANWWLKRQLNELLLAGCGKKTGAIDINPSPHLLAEN